MADLMRWQGGQASSLVKSLRSSLDTLPLGKRVNDLIDLAEDAVVDRLRDRLDLVTGNDSSLSAQDNAPPRDKARALMRSLIEQANSQSEEDARQHLYILLLNQLVPDEIRMLGALSDGATHAMIHIAGGPPIGPVMKRVLDNYSYVGRSASVRLEDMVPQYLEHMIRLGLVESGPEDKSLEVKYEVMSYDKTVRALGKTIEKEFKFPPRILRRTIRATELGRTLWAECAPEDVGVEPVI